MKNLHPIFQRALVPFAPITATGNHRVAQNDEDEPEHDEAAAIEADLKDSRDRFAARRAREEEAGLRELDALRREGKL